MRIDIDDEVIAALTAQQQDGETLNSIIRRLLGLPAEPAAPRLDAYGTSIRGMLAAGLLQADQTVTWARPRLGIVHTATIDARGFLDLGDGRRFTSPVAAANAISGYSGSSWSVWKTADGTTLQQLRQRAHLAAIPPEQRLDENTAWAGALAALVQAGLLQPGQELTYRSQAGAVYQVTVDVQGFMRGPEGQRFATPGRAFEVLTGAKGRAWQTWRTGDGTSLHDLRQQLATRSHR